MSGRHQAVTVGCMQYGKSRTHGVWHRLHRRLTVCRRGADGHTAGWEVSRKVPPRGEQRCELCFPECVPVTTAGGWDLDRFLAGL